MLKTISRGAAPLAFLLAGACGQTARDVLLGPSTTVVETPPAAALPLPSPTPEPTPVPVATPTPDPGDDIPPYLPNNTAPVARVTARVFFIEIGGAEIPGSAYATEAPLGARLHLDCTPRDASGQPTRAVEGPQWSINDARLVAGGSKTVYSPAFLVKAPGTFVAAVTIDGHRSDDIVVRFY